MTDFTILQPKDNDYPSLLGTLPDPPQALYVRGNAAALSQPSIALVGSRHASAYGEKVARELASGLAALGIVTVSGLAKGIDAAVHHATVVAGGKTIAVMGTGPDLIYPSENRRLAEEILASGALVTEYPPGTEPHSDHFPKRNRIIAALSLGTVVVEAAHRSGALITARLAAESGRDVFAVPGPITSSGSQGPHRLISQGAKLVGTLEDILCEIDAFKSLVRASNGDEASQGELGFLTEEEQDLFNLLSLEPVSIDRLLQRSEGGAGRLAKSLLSLEIKGAIRALPGKRYVRSR